MVSINVGGEDKTAQISDWVIYWSDKYKTLQLTCHYPSGKTYTRPLSDCRVSPMRELGKMLLSRSGSAIVTPIERAIIYGERYAIVHYSDAGKPYVYKMDGIRPLLQVQLIEVSRITGHASRACPGFRV